jgi:WD40 repeat protein
MRVFLEMLVLILVILSPQMGQAQEREDEPSNIASLRWSPDGSMIAIASGGNRCPLQSMIKILDSQTTELLRTITIDCQLTGIDWSPDGTKLAVSSIDTLGARVWDIQTGQLLMTIQDGGQGLTDIKWRPNGLELAVAAGSNTISLIDPDSGERVGLAPIGGTAMDWNPDGTKLGSVSPYQNFVFVADMVSGQEIMLLEEHSEPLVAVDWSPDGTKLGSGGGDNSVRLWDAATGENLQILEGHVDTILEVRWSPNSLYIASASYDGTVRVWNVETGEELAVFDYGGAVYTVDWSPDGDFLAFGGASSDGQDAQLEIVPFEIEEAA